MVDIDGRAAAAEAVASGSSSVLVRGEAGIGKSTLVQDALERSGVGRVIATGLQALAQVPYLPFRAALPDVTFSAEAGRLTGDVGSALGGRLLVAEDLHWWDRDSLDLLAELLMVRRVVATTRPAEDGSERLDELFGEVGCVLDLEPLDDDEAREVIARVRPAAAPSDTTRWLREAGGNPLALELLAAGADHPTDLTPAAAFVSDLDRDELESLARLALSDTPPVVDADVAARLVARRVAAWVDGGLTVRHALLGDAAVALVGAATRRRLHLELGMRAADPASRAVHLAAAGAEDAAAAARGAAARAPTVWSRAEFLLLAVRSGDRASLPGAIDALSLAGRYQEAIDLAGDRLAGSADDGPAVTLALARAHWALTDIDAARRQIERGLAADRVTDVQAAELLSLRSRIECRVDWDLDRAIITATAALDRISEDQHAARASVVGALGLTELMVGDPLWQQHLDEAARCAQVEHDVHDVVTITDAAFFGHLLSGEPSRCRSLAEQAIELTQGASAAWNGYFRAAALLAQLHVEGRTLRVAEEAERLLRRPLSRKTREMARQVLALASADGGLDGRGTELALETLADPSDDSARAGALWSLAESAFFGGDHESAIDAAARCVELPVPGFPPQVCCALIGLWARRELDLPVEDRWVAACSSSFTNLAGAAEEAAGLGSGDPADASQRFELAAELWARMSLRASTRATWAAGRSALDAGDHVRGVELLCRADELAGRIGLVGLRRRVRRDLRGRTVEPGLLAAWPVATSVELQVMDRVARGHTSARIARALAISPSTVETHVRNAMDRHGARTRTQAAALSVAAASDRPRSIRPSARIRIAEPPARPAERPRTGPVRAFDLREVPEVPWRLDGVPTVVVGVVVDEDAAAAALIAAVRGADLELSVAAEDDSARFASLLDGLRRVAEVQILEEPGAGHALIGDDLRMVRLLAGGSTLDEIAAELHLSRRTVHRRLTALRGRVGVATNRELALSLGSEDG